MASVVRDFGDGSPARADSGGRPGGPPRIAVLRALKLGDLLCTVPALRALRAAVPDADVRLIGLAWAAELVDRFDAYLDGLFVLPGFPGFPEVPFDARAFARFLVEVQTWSPDLVLQLHGSGDLSNPLALLLGGRRTAGFFVPGQYCPDPERFIPYPADLPEVGRHLRILHHLGIEPQGTHKELPVREADRRALAETLATRDGEGLKPGRYAVVHPGASVPERRWQPERFGTVAAALAGRGLQVVVTGAAGEAPVTAAVRHAMRQPSIDATGRTSLGTLAALLADAALLISNDTGVMHVAEGTDTPLVAISFDPESWRWAPEDSTRFRVLRGGHDVAVSEVIDAGLEQLCSRPARFRSGLNRPVQTPDVALGCDRRG